MKRAEDGETLLFLFIKETRERERERVGGGEKLNQI